MIDKLLLKHVGLPHILVLTVHLVNFLSWVSQGGHSEQLLLFAIRGWVAYVILVSAQGPNPSFFLFWGTFIRLGDLLGQGLGLGLGPGLDKNKKNECSRALCAKQTYRQSYRVTP